MRNERNYIRFGEEPRNVASKFIRGQVAVAKQRRCSARAIDPAGYPRVNTSSRSMKGEHSWSPT